MNHYSFIADTNVLLAVLYSSENKWSLRFSGFKKDFALQNSGYISTQAHSLVLESHIFIIPMLGGPNGWQLSSWFNFTSRSPEWCALLRTSGPSLLPVPSVNQPAVRSVQLLCICGSLLPIFHYWRSMIKGIKWVCFAFTLNDVSKAVC